MHRSFLDGLVACDTCAAVRRRTSPILGPHSPEQFERSRVPLVHGSPSGATAPAHCDASPGSAAWDRFAPAASVRASRRSSFRRLLVIKRTFWACPTITSCPSAVNNRLTHGECVPVSIAMRHRGRLPNTCFMASGVVASLCSKTISPASFKTRYALERSPRSNPMVGCPWKMFSPLVAHSANLLHCRSPFHCASSTSNIGSVSHPAGDRPSPNLEWLLTGHE